MRQKEKRNNETWLRNYVHRLDPEDYVRDIVVALIVGLILGATFW